MPRYTSRSSLPQIPRYGQIDRESFGSYVGAPIVWVLPKHGENDFSEAEERYRSLFLKAVDEKDHFKVAAANTVECVSVWCSIVGGVFISVGERGK